jgi:hypothetical protein
MKDFFTHWFLAKNGRKTSFKSTHTTVEEVVDYNPEAIERISI